jgi:hypothetical protein
MSTWDFFDDDKYSHVNMRFFSKHGVLKKSHVNMEHLFLMDNGHVGRPCEVSLAPRYPELFVSHGTSIVTRTSGRGHVAEAKTNVIEVSGLSIRVSPSHP